MRTAFTASAIVALTLAIAAINVSGQDSSPFGPLTTNNGVSACVQFGSCTDGKSYGTTETQYSPVSAPPSSVHYAQPTNAAESSAYISQLAASGASAAYASRIANGQGSGGSPNGATAPVDTASVVAGTAPGTVSAPSRTGGSKDGAVRLDTSLTAVWTMGIAIAGMAMGGAFIL